MIRAIMAITCTAATPQMKNWIVSGETFQAKSPIDAFYRCATSLLIAPASIAIIFTMTVTRSAGSHHLRYPDPRDPTLTFRLGESASYRLNTSPGNALAFCINVASLPLGVGEPSSLGILYLEGILVICRWRWYIQSYSIGGTPLAARHPPMWGPAKWKLLIPALTDSGKSESSGWVLSSTIHTLYKGVNNSEQLRGSHGKLRRTVTHSNTANEQGVPALFRWLSKKYPKIVNKVAEETPTKVRNQDGEIVEVPVRYESKNPNGFEVDNLYRTCLRHVASIALDGLDR